MSYMLCLATNRHSALINKPLSKEEAASVWIVCIARQVIVPPYFFTLSFQLLTSKGPKYLPWIWWLDPGLALSMGRSAIRWNPGAACSVQQTKHKIHLMAVATPGLLTQFVQCVVSSFITNLYMSHVVLFAQHNTALHFQEETPY